MSDGRPVARLVAPVIIQVAILVAALAILAIVGVAASTRSVGYLTDELQPAASANLELRQDLSDMQAAVRVWAGTGDQAAVEDYRRAEARLPGHWGQVRDFAVEDAELEALAVEEEAAARAWIEGYAEPRLDDPGGPGTFQPDAFERGIELFAAFREANTGTTEAFDQRLQEARDDASFRLQGTILAVVLVGLFGAWVIARSRRRLLKELADPLHELEVVVQRMAARDRDVRAAAAGPREVRAVAASLNDLADAQARASAVEERIQQALRNLDVAKDDFVSNVSHELRTPLTTISGYLELVADEFEGRMAPRHLKMLDASRRNVERLSLLIEDLLTLSRAEAAGTDLEQLDLVAVVRDVVTDVRMTAARRGIEIELAAPEVPPLVLGDRVMLHRAFLNVLANAVKFSHEGGVIEARVELAGDEATILIKDHGIGIPADEMDRLGTRFFRASNAVREDIAGTGLGVRIVQTIVDRHAGTMLVDSEVGEGTSVLIRLPAGAGTDRQAPASSGTMQ